MPSTIVKVDYFYIGNIDTTPILIVKFAYFNYTLICTIHIDDL